MVAQLSLTRLIVSTGLHQGIKSGRMYSTKWPYNSPMQLGQFPATALAFRKGYIQEASEPLVYEEKLWKIYGIVKCH